MRTERAPRNEILDSHQRLRLGFWLRGLSRPAMVLLGCFLWVFFVLHEYGGRIGNDGSMLFSYVRSMVIDGDLDLENEFDEFLPPKFDLVRERLESGRIRVPHQELGPALLWLPFFVSAHVLVKVGAALGGAIPADGYSYPYIHAVCFGSLIYAFLGVVLSYLMAREYFTPELASWGTVVLWLASPLLWYTVYEPTMPHAVSLAGVAFFLYCCFRARDGERLVAWMLVGLSAGVMVSIQRYNIYFLIVPVVILLSHLRQIISRREKVRLRKAFRVVGLSFLAFMVTSAPLWLYHLSATGAVLRRIDLPSRALEYWRSPSISTFLFSSNHGLFSWAPVAYLSVLGLLMMLWRRNWIAGVYLVTLSVGIYLLSSTWEEGASFGSRRMTEAFPNLLGRLLWFPRRGQTFSHSPRRDVLCLPRHLELGACPASPTGRSASNGHLLFLRGGGPRYRPHLPDDRTSFFDSGQLDVLHSLWSTSEQIRLHLGTQGVSQSDYRCRIAVG